MPAASCLACLPWRAAGGGPGRRRRPPRVGVAAARAARAAVAAHPGVGLVLAVDIGSSSVRCTAYTPEAEAVEGSTAQVKRSMLDLATGTADAPALLKVVDEAVDGCLGALREAGLAALVRNVGFCSFVMNLVGTDEHGQAVTPVYTYADQHASTPRHARELQKELQDAGELEATWQRTGTPVHTAYAPAQLRRLASEEPELLAKVACWQTVSAYVQSRWLGVAHLPVSYSEASWTGLLDFRALGWDGPLASRVGPGATRARLPELADADIGVRLLAKTYAARWPEIANVRIFLGIGDGAAANMGSGCGGGTCRVAVTIGTSAAVRVVLQHQGASGGEAPSPSPLTGASCSIAVPKGLWCYRVDSARVLLGGALTDGGTVREWLHSVARIDASDDRGARKRDEALLAEVAAMPPDSHGLTVLPFLSGERAPGWQQDARATVTGIRRGTTTAHLVRAGMESVVLRLAAVLELMGPHLPPDAGLVASGEALRASGLWQQALADASGRPVIVESGGELTSRGVAVLVLEACGDWVAGQLPAAPERTVSPDPAASAAYGAARARQEALYARLYGDAC